MKIKKRAILNNKKLPSYTILSIDLLNELLREKNVNRQSNIK